MSRLVRQRARIARVRAVQHNLAAGKAVRAFEELRGLESSSDRLATLRGGLEAGEGGTNGAMLAALGELAMRIDQARVGLVKTIDGARAQAAAVEMKRLAARRNQESAERLQQRAAQAEARLAERKAAVPRRNRNPICEGGSK